MERHVIDECVPSCLGDGIEELEEESDEGGLAATRTTADGDFLACVDSEVDVSEGQFGRAVQQIFCATWNVSTLYNHRRILDNIRISLTCNSLKRPSARPHHFQAIVQEEQCPLHLFLRA